MRVLPGWIGILVLLADGVWAGPEQGVTARFIPDRVRPGDVFELRVEMDRADYARFALQVPPHEHLHRVAVDTEPVTLEDGRYRQRESWLLQADRSGELVIEGASVKLMTGGVEQHVELPLLRLEVMSYAGADTSPVPVGFPGAPQDTGPDPGMPWWGIVMILALAGGVIWWIRVIRHTAPPPEPERASVVETALGELKAGRLPASALEWLMDERGSEWPRDLREAVEKLLYAGRGDPVRLAELLEQEGTR